MELAKINDAKYATSRLDDLLEEGRKAASGGVDATIHGRYFGDHLLVNEKIMLRALAIKYVARRMWREIMLCRDFGVVITLDGEIPSAEYQVAFFVTDHSISDEDERSDLKAAIAHLYH